MPSIKKGQKGIVFNIQNYSVHDGPGIRTVVFLTGCPLRCKWCSNPESQSLHPQLAYNRNKCITIDQCIRCLEVCTAGAISEDGDGKAQISRDTCTHCLLCADVCPPTALRVYGEEKTVLEVITEVEKDSAFYTRSGGGMTLGGGEPMQQPEFAIAVLKEGRKRRIHTAMETCGHCKTEDLVTACGYLNYLLFDLKVIDAGVHKEATGVSNDLILKNFTAIRETFPELPILVRTPVIPGINDNPEAIRAICDLIVQYDKINYEILPYHRLGTPKYEYLGSTYPMGESKLDDGIMESLEKMLKEEYGELLRNKA